MINFKDIINEIINGKIVLKQNSNTTQEKLEFFEGLFETYSSLTTLINSLPKEETIIECRASLKPLVSLIKECESELGPLKDSHLLSEKQTQRYNNLISYLYVEPNKKNKAMR